MTPTALALARLAAPSGASGAGAAAAPPAPATAAPRVDFDALFRRIYPSLHRYAHRMTGDVDAADDIAQEAFVRLLTRPLPEDEARLWLFTVATNLFRDRARTVRRRERLLAGGPTPSTPFPRPDEAVERADEVRRVREALGRLAPRERQMLLMREEGFRYEEIARATGVAPGSVGTLLARALKRFAAVYPAPQDEEREG